MHDTCARPEPGWELNMERYGTRKIGFYKNQERRVQDRSKKGT